MSTTTLLFTIGIICGIVGMTSVVLAWIYNMQVDALLYRARHQTRWKLNWCIELMCDPHTSEQQYTELETELLDNIIKYRYP